MVFEALRRSFRNTFRRNRKHDDREDGRNLIKCKIALLDSTDISVNLQKQAYGKDLIVRVLRHLDLVEKDYFGLQYMDTNQVPHWLDPTKKVKKQVHIGPPFTLHFRVKFYAMEPHLLKEELTRYHYFLQLKQDVREGKLHPTVKQAIDLGSYAVQSELGDFDNTIHVGNYVSEFRLVRDQSEEVERAIAKKHRLLAGMNPAECEIKYLTIAQNLEFYGMDRHEVIGEDGKTCIVGLTPKGIVVVKNGQKLGDHNWRSITNITFKQSRFILCAKTSENEQEEYRFELPSSRASKHLWKCAIEYHSFFRLVATTEEPERSKPAALLSFGSRFRYSGKTLHQATKDDSAGRKSMMFKRTRSERFAQRSTIGYIRIGSVVWAKAVNGDYYKGVVTAMTDKVHVKFDNGDTIAHEKNDETNIVYDMAPNANELKIGTQVIAHWSGVSAFLAGTITKIESAKYHVLYEDGDKGMNRIEQMRILKPPLYFGPGSGRSNLQKKYSMKTTILSGNSAGNTVMDGPSRVQVDVDRRSAPKSTSYERSESSHSSHSSHKSTSANRQRSENAQVSNVQKPASSNQQKSESPRTSSKHSGSHVSNGDADAKRGEKSHSQHRSSGGKSSSRTKSPPQNSHAADKGAHDDPPPPPPARMTKNQESAKCYQITDL